MRGYEVARGGTRLAGEEILGSRRRALTVPLPWILSMQQSHQRSENQRRSGDPAPPAPADAWAGAPVPHIHPDPQGGCQQVQTIDQPAAGACGDLEQPLDLH